MVDDVEELRKFYRERVYTKRVPNPTKEEQFATEVAKYLVEHRKPEITAKELEAIARKLGYADIEGLIKYIQSAQGKEYFKKTIRLELWQAGYRPRGWEL